MRFFTNVFEKKTDLWHGKHRDSYIIKKNLIFEFVIFFVLLKECQLRYNFFSYKNPYCYCKLFSEQFKKKYLFFVTNSKFKQLGFLLLK